jgi:hypothetical protein
MSTLFCVSHYGYYDEHGFFDGYLGDGITRESESLVGVYNTKKAARFALKAEEEADEREDNRTRAMEVQKFNPTDFVSQQYFDNWGWDSSVEMVVNDAVEEGRWHADIAPVDYLRALTEDDDEEDED